MLRNGMWVRFNSETGILVKQEEGTAEVHFVNDDGETVRMEQVPAAALTQAKLADIPAPRQPDNELAEKLGYI